MARKFSLGLFASCVLCAHTSFAETCTWYGSNNDWNAPTNWRCGSNDTNRVPASEDIAVIPNVTNIPNFSSLNGPVTAPAEIRMEANSKLYVAEDLTIPKFTVSYVSIANLNLKPESINENAATVYITNGSTLTVSDNMTVEAPFVVSNGENATNGSFIVAHELTANGNALIRASEYGLFYIRGQGTQATVKSYLTPINKDEVLAWENIIVDEGANFTLDTASSTALSTASLSIQNFTLADSSSSLTILDNNPRLDLILKNADLNGTINFSTTASSVVSGNALLHLGGESTLGESTTFNTYNTTRELEVEGHLTINAPRLELDKLYIRAKADTYQLTNSVLIDGEGSLSINSQAVTTSFSINSPLEIRLNNGLFLTKGNAEAIAPITVSQGVFQISPSTKLTVSNNAKLFAQNTGYTEIAGTLLVTSELAPQEKTLPWQVQLSKSGKIDDNSFYTLYFSAFDAMSAQRLEPWKGEIKTVPKVDFNAAIGNDSIPSVVFSNLALANKLTTEEVTREHVYIENDVTHTETVQLLPENAEIEFDTVTLGKGATFTLAKVFQTCGALTLETSEEPGEPARIEHFIISPTRKCNVSQEAGSSTTNFELQLLGQGDLNITNHLEISSNYRLVLNGNLNITENASAEITAEVTLSLGNIHNYGTLLAEKVTELDNSDESHIINKIVRAAIVQVPESQSNTSNPPYLHNHGIMQIRGSVDGTPGSDGKAKQWILRNDGELTISSQETVNINALNIQDWNTNGIRYGEADYKAGTVIVEYVEPDDAASSENDSNVSAGNTDASTHYDVIINAPKSIGGILDLQNENLNILFNGDTEASTDYDTVNDTTIYGVGTIVLPDAFPKRAMRLGKGSLLSPGIRTIHTDRTETHSFGTLMIKGGHLKLTEEARLLFHLKGQSNAEVGDEQVAESDHLKLDESLISLEDGKTITVIAKADIGQEPGVAQRFNIIATGTALTPGLFKLQLDDPEFRITTDLGIYIDFPNDPKVAYIKSEEDKTNPQITSITAAKYQGNGSESLCGSFLKIGDTVELTINFSEYVKSPTPSDGFQIIFENGDTVDVANLSIATRSTKVYYTITETNYEDAAAPDHEGKHPDGDPFKIKSIKKLGNGVVDRSTKVTDGITGNALITSDNGSIDSINFINFAKNDCSIIVDCIRPRFIAMETRNEKYQTYCNKDCVQDYSTTSGYDLALVLSEESKNPSAVANAVLLITFNQNQRATASIPKQSSTSEPYTEISFKYIFRSSPSPDTPEEDGVPIGLRIQSITPQNSAYMLTDMAGNVIDLSITDENGLGNSEDKNLIVDTVAPLFTGISLCGAHANDVKNALRNGTDKAFGAGKTIPICVNVSEKLIPNVTAGNTAAISYKLTNNASECSNTYGNSGELEEIPKEIPVEYIVEENDSPDGERVLNLDTLSFKSLADQALNPIAETASLANKNLSNYLSSQGMGRILIDTKRPRLKALDAYRDPNSNTIKVTLKFTKPVYLTQGSELKINLKNFKDKPDGLQIEVTSDVFGGYDESNAKDEITAESEVLTENDSSNGTIKIESIELPQGSKLLDKPGNLIQINEIENTRQLSSDYLNGYDTGIVLDMSKPKLKSINVVEMGESSCHKINHTLQFEIGFSKDVKLTDGEFCITLETNEETHATQDICASPAEINGSGIIGGDELYLYNLSYTVKEGDSSSHLKLTNVKVTGGVLQDGSNNTVNLADAIQEVLNGFNGDKVCIDGIVPQLETITSGQTQGYLKANETVLMTVKFSEPVKLVSNDFKLQLNSGTYATVENKNDANTEEYRDTYTASYTIKDNDTNVEALAVEKAIGEAEDAAGNSANLDFKSALENTHLNIDTVPATLVKITGTEAKGENALTAGDYANIELHFSEPVTLSGSLNVKLNIGTTARISSSGSSNVENTQVLKAKYMVQPGDQIEKLNVVELSFASGGKLEDRAKNQTESLSIERGQNLANNTTITLAAQQSIIQREDASVEDWGTESACSAAPGSRSSVWPLFLALPLLAFFRRRKA